MSEEQKAFVEKMKKENPEAFAFLGRASMNLLNDLEKDLKLDFSDWLKKAEQIMGVEKLKSFLLLKIKELGP